MKPRQPTLAAMPRRRRIDRLGRETEQRGTTRRPSRDETSSLSDVQRLQRTLGNQAVGRLLKPTAPSSPSDAVAVQRVGGQKIGFEMVDPGTDAIIKEGQALLLAEWANVRQTEHNLKVGTEKTDVEAGAQELIDVNQRRKNIHDYMTAHSVTEGVAKAHYPVVPQPKTGQGFSKYYYGKLTGRQRTRQADLLTSNSPAFADTRLAYDSATGIVRYRRDNAQPYVDIATIKKGDQAFKLKANTVASGLARDTHEKHGVARGFNDNEDKEYVRDSRGVATRRYAYVEKNYWQAMEFFMTNRHEGRFQQFMKAAGDVNPNIYEARVEEVDLVRGQPAASTTGTLTREQMAVAHQKLGSRADQRGVSLSSTPKVGVTYVNTGQNFRTGPGFLFKVDLAKIPLESAGGPVLINHYSQGGVIDATGYSTLRERNKPSTYPYKESAVHARELYLEYLKPEWIVAIESHPTTGTGTTVDRTTSLGTRPSLFALAKSQFGGEQFESGFDFGLANPTNTSLNSNVDFGKGFDQARSFVRGWTAGSGARPASTPTNPNPDANAATAARVTVAQYVYDQSMAVDLPPNEFDMYRVGYLQGRAGTALITSHTGLPH